MAQPIDLRLTGGLTLNELLHYLEDDDDVFNSVSVNGEVNIALMPPTNATADLTDEDSGDEDSMTVNNLPASQLMAEVEIFDPNKNLQEDLDYSDTVDNNPDETNENGHVVASEWDTEDHISLHYYQASKKKFNWKNKDLDVENVEWPLKYDCRPSLTPKQIFYLFFDTEIIEMFVRFGNEYAQKKNYLGNITTDEMYSFFGILLLSGYVSTPRRRMYWEQRKDSHNDLVSGALSRDRFEYIMQNLHCVNNDELDTDDRFAKVRPLFSKLNKKFKMYAPHFETHSVDESMIPYFGRHGLKQFIKGKPIRYGFKIWMGATSQGYCMWMEPYQGKNSVIEPKYKLFGLGPSIILQYCDVLQSMGDFPYQVFFDNFFTTVPLLHELKRRGIKATGTIRENRMSKCPVISKSDAKKKPRGFMDYRTTEEKSVVIVKWNDNSCVNVASNCHSVEPVHQVTRYSQKEKKRVQVEQPNVISKYNIYMGGVDRCDQNVSLYRIGIRGKKWYFPILAYCLDIAEQNAWQLHRHLGGKLDHLAFRRSVAEGMLESHQNSSRKRGRPNSMEHRESKLDNKDHYLVSQEKQTRCRVCHKKVQKKCAKCQVALHVNCFPSYHGKYD